VADPRVYLRVIWRYRWIAVAGLVGIPAIVFVISSLLPKTYEATATVQAGPPATAESAIELVESTGTAEEAAGGLGLGRPAALVLLGEIEAAPLEQQPGQRPTAPTEDDPQLFTVTAESGIPQRAARVANAFATAYASRYRNTVKENTRAIRNAIAREQGGEGSSAGSVSQKAQGRFVAAQLQRLQSLKENRNANLIVERAQVPRDPVSPNPLRNSALGLVFSLLLGGALIVIVNAFDRSIKDPEQLPELAGTPLLAAIPETAIHDGPAAPAAKDAFQALRANLTYFNPDRSPGSVVIVSPGKGDGATSVVVDLAIASAEANQDVVVIDADLRNSAVAARLGVEPRWALEDVVNDEKDLDDALVDIDVDTDTGRLRILSGGAPAPNPAAILTSPRMQSLLADVTGRADLVLIDTPTLLAVSDAVPLVAQASGTVLVVRLDHTRVDAVRRAREVIESARGALLGVVATGAGRGPFERPEYKYGYGSLDGDRAAVPGRSLADRLTGLYRQVRGSTRGGPGTEVGAESTADGDGSRLSRPLRRVRERWGPRR
jgi:capsular exopolysaccharide synthesis family protein